MMAIAQMMLGGQEGAEGALKELTSLAQAQGKPPENIGIFRLSGHLVEKHPPQRGGAGKGAGKGRFGRGQVEERTQKPRDAQVAMDRGKRPAVARQRLSGPPGRKRVDRRLRGHAAACHGMADPFAGDRIDKPRRIPREQHRAPPRPRPDIAEGGDAPVLKTRLRTLLTQLRHPIAHSNNAHDLPPS